MSRVTCAYLYIVSKQVVCTSAITENTNDLNDTINEQHKKQRPNDATLYNTSGKVYNKEKK